MIQERTLTPLFFGENETYFVLYPYCYTNKIVDNNGSVVTRFSGLHLSILHYLMQNSGRIVSNHDIHKVVWPDNEYSYDLVTNYIHILREKLEKIDPILKDKLVTLHGHGYLWDHTTAHSTSK